MASFTDNVGQLTHYTPYISTNPTEAMVSTGIKLEEQYQTGLEKVNSYVSSLNGMDFAKQGAKDYVDKQLNNLKTGLSKSLAGDLSNQSLVNQIGGAARTIANDKVVQTNLMGTAMMKSGYSQMEAAKKEGKSSVANEWDYNTKVSSWINDGKLDTDFSGKYTQYTDTFKKLQDIAKSVGEDSNIIQQLFITDADGNPIAKNGRLEYNDVMAETLLKGKDKNKILQAFQSGLDSNDYNQLSINGRYELKDVSPEKLVESISDSFNNYEKNHFSQVEYLKNKLLEVKTDNTIKNAQPLINSLEQQIAATQDNYAKRKQQTELDKEAAFINPDGVKSKLYTNNYLDSLSSVFSNKESYTKYSKNPAVEMMLDKEKLKLQNQAELRQWKEFEYRKQHDKALLDFDVFKEMKKQGKNADGTAISGELRDAAIPLEETSTQMTDAFETGLKEDTDTQFELSKKVAIAHWKATNQLKGNNLTDDEVLRGIEAYSKKLGLSLNDYIVMQADKARDNFYDKKNSIIGNEYEEDFSNLQRLNSIIGQKKLILDNKTKFIQEEAKRQGFTPFDLSKADIKPVKTTLTLGGGGRGEIRNEQVTLSKEDIYNLSIWLNHNNEGTAPSFMDSQAIKKQADKAKQELIKKYGETGFQSMQSLYGDEGFDFADANPFHLLLGHDGGKQNPEIKKALQNIRNDSWKKTNKLTEDYFRKSGQVNIPKIAPVYTDKKEQRENVTARIISTLSDYADISGGGDYTDLIATVNEADSKFQVNITPPQSKRGQSTYELQVVDKKGNIKTRTITEPQYQYITGNNPLTVSENLIEGAINVSPFNSTNLSYAYTDKDAYKGAILKHDDFKNVTKYNIAMDFVKSSSGNYFPKLYYKKGDSWELLQMYNGVPGFQGLTKEEMLTFPTSINDEIITRLIQ